MPDWTDWTESTELCVTCPVCAFAFDSIHTSGEGYSCPACAEIELDRTIATLRALVEAKRERSVTRAVYDYMPHRSCLICARHWPVGNEPEHARECALVLTEASMREK